MTVGEQIKKATADSLIVAGFQDGTFRPTFFFPMCAHRHRTESGADRCRRRLVRTLDESPRWKSQRDHLA